MALAFAALDDSTPDALAAGVDTVY